MKPRYLLPHSWKKWGWILSTAGLALGIYYMADREIPWLIAKVYQHEILGDHGWTWGKMNMTGTFAGMGLIAGLSMIAFSKLKTEDEFSSRTRLESLQWAVYINYALLFLAFAVFYNLAFFAVMIYNLFTILIIFNIRFAWVLYRQKQFLKHEE